MRVNAVVLGIASWWLVIAAAPARAQDGEEGRSVLDGVYAKDQATQGRTRFDEQCASCHAGSQFSGPAFQSRWAGRNVRSLFRLIRTTMPYDNPGGLTRDEYAAIVAYILELNGYPAGQSALPGDDAELSEIRFEPRSDPLPPPAGEDWGGGLSRALHSSPGAGGAGAASVGADPPPQAQARVTSRGAAPGR